MITKKSLVGILTMVLVFGIIVAGCGNSDGSTTLTANKWTIGNITRGVNEIVYSFPVTSGRTYNIWVNDYDGNGTYSTDVEISAYHSNGSVIFHEEDDNWDNPASFVATSNGRVTIRVLPLDSDEIGTFAIVYSTNNNRP